MAYKQLTREERYQIHALKKAGKSIGEIARLLERHPSTIWREIGRNTGGNGYRPKQAQELAEVRRRNAPKAVKFTEKVRQYVDEKLRLQWSPEQIAGRIERDIGETISHERIYQYLAADRKAGGTLWQNLRRARKKRKKRYGSADNRGKIPNRVGIEKRPAVVDAKVRRGDWEGDTVIGENHQGGLVTLVERKSQYVLIEPVQHKSAPEVTEAILRCAGPLSGIFKTLTFDNGKEFSGHEAIAAALGVSVYFARAYHSWERGLNENTNGLIRQYFPKKMPLRDLSIEWVKQVQDLLNHRPRKTLGYLTPHEVLVEGKPIRV
jgi:IS30 family transposase